MKNLPDDVNLLHQIVTDLVDKNQSLEDENSTLKSQLALLKKQRFGASSEKQKQAIDEQIDELEDRVENDEATSSAASHQVSDSNQTPKNKPKRQPLPDHLPREDVTIQPEPACTECGGHEFRKISDDVSQMLEYIPASFKVIRTIRPRCACVACEHIMQGELPSHPISKGKAGPGLLAHILVQKYANHLPCYRQSQIYEREGVYLSRKTMAGWAGQCATLLEPLIDVLKQYVLSCSHIHGDDTPVKVLAPGLGKTKTGRLWAYVRDGRYHAEYAPPAVWYAYSPDRKAQHPHDHLKDYHGILHADAYPGFNGLYITDKDGNKAISAAACWAHARRKFYEIAITTTKTSIASQALMKISDLYRIEADISTKPADERLATRQQKSTPIVDEWFIWLKQVRNSLPKKSPTLKAIHYTLKLEKSLRLFLHDGRVEIDNNAAERAIRAIALGRKNWLFAGSDKGGETAAKIFSLIETCKLNNINPQTYLHYVLKNIQDHNAKKLQELLPWNVKIE